MIEHAGAPLTTVEAPLSAVPHPPTADARPANAMIVEAEAPAVAHRVMRGRGSGGPRVSIAAIAVASAAVAVWMMVNGDFCVDGYYEALCWTPQHFT